MGCDIHFFTERWTNQKEYFGPKDIQLERDRKLEVIIGDQSESEFAWVTADTWEKSGNDYWVSSEFYEDRNYFLFAILADVRNGYDIEPLSQPKGIPEDSCYPIKYIVDQWSGDGHSHSYFTLKELLEVDWDKYCTKSPDVDRSNWLDGFKEKLNNLKELDTNPENVRCVFFFDN